MKNEINLSHFCCSSKSTCDPELVFGYVVSNSMCRLYEKIDTKLLSKSFIMIYLVFMLFLP
jgi:hypothetical protein